jgi:endonuclease/exonuclease/phosphatase family metal-dependent hydrolase
MAATHTGRSELKMLTFNMHAGARTDGMHDYVLRSWQHFLPDANKAKHLSDIAAMLREFDVVALQEVDGGSSRSMFVQQAQFLADAAGFVECIDQRNRLVGFKRYPLLHSGNAILSKTNAQAVSLLSLPDALKGRGAIVAKFDHWTCVNVHLSLSVRARERQLSFLANALDKTVGPMIILGDFNCLANDAVVEAFCQSLQLIAEKTPPSFPAWQPKRAIDLILSRGVVLHNARALPMLASDHLPIAVTAKILKS